MSTRLFLQESLKKLDGVDKVLICNSLVDDGSVYIYVQASNYQFDEKFKNYIQNYVNEYFPCHLQYKIKPYSDIIKDKIPPEVVLPGIVESLALNNPNCNKENCKIKLQRAFPFLGEIELSLENNILIVKTNTPLSTYYKQMVEFYGKELIIIGLFIKVVTP